MLVLSSITCQIGVFASERGDVFGIRRWFFYTFLMGSIFVAGQSYEYFVHNEFSLATNSYGSVYYLTTGFHGLHVLGGMLAMVVLVGRAANPSFGADETPAVEVVSYYWHFVDVVWIALFATIYVLQ